MSEPQVAIRIPPRDRRVRWIVLLYGAGVLIWSSLEDTDVLRVVLVALGLTVLVAYLIVTGRLGGKHLMPPALLIGAALTGAGVGAGTAISAALLMVWKTGMHAHPFPDYPTGLILDTLNRAPVWALAGALMALALALVIQSQKTFTTENTENTEK